MDSARSVVKMALAAALGLLVAGCGGAPRPTVIEWGDADGLVARRVVQGNALRRPREAELTTGRERVAALCWCQDGDAKLLRTDAHHGLGPGHCHGTPRTRRGPRERWDLSVEHWRRGKHPRQPDYMAFPRDAVEFISDPDEPLIKRALAVSALPMYLLLLGAGGPR